jgi:hypothetical protein
VSEVRGHEWARAADALVAELDEASRYASELGKRHRERHRELWVQRTQALKELCYALLPRFDQSALAQAASLAGYPTLLQAQPIERMRAEENELRARASTIEADPRYVHREHLKDPRGGKLVLELAEVLDARRDVRASMERFEHPRLEHLLQVGYGTAKYAVPVWRLSYYADWKAGDEILAKCPGMSFEQLVSECLRARDAELALETRIRELGNEIAQIEALEAERVDLEEKLQSLVARHHEQAAEALGGHILGAGAQVIGARLASVPELEILTKRLFGLDAKLAYFVRLADLQLAPLEREIQAAKTRAAYEAQKYRRPKNAYRAYPRADFERRFRPRRERYQKGWQRYQRASDMVYGFDRYDRADFASDLLWWDLMTDGRIDGDFLPEVQAFRREHPDYRYDRSGWSDAHPPDPIASFESEPEHIFDPS